MNSKRGRVLWIVRTAVMIALLVALQWATSGFGQFVTGSCVNAVLALAALICGLWSGVVVAILSPLCAFLLGIGPKLIAIIPAIALGNLVLVLLLHVIIGTSRASVWKPILGIAAASVAKFAALYIVVVQLLVPAMGDALPAKQAQTFSVMFSWPQLVTALIGSTLAVLVTPVIRKALTRKA